MYREKLRGHAAACVAIRAALPAAKLDPAALWCLREFARDEEALRRLGDTPELARADAAFAQADPGLEPAGNFVAGAMRRAPTFADGRPPAPGASLFDWYAWALAVTDANPSPQRAPPFPPPAANAAANGAATRRPARRDMLRPLRDRQRDRCGTE